LRLELAQYQELLAFSQFGTELDAVSQRRLKRGAIIVELLKQPEFSGYSFVQQTLMLFLWQDNFLDAIPLEQVRLFATQFVSFTRSVYSDLYEHIKNTQDFSDHDREQARSIAHEFSKIFVEA